MKTFDSIWHPTSGDPGNVINTLYLFAPVQVVLMSGTIGNA
jgi:hypothetical protein